MTANEDVYQAILSEAESSLDFEPEILLQPETGPISNEQLVAEVKGIYTGLVMGEAKCIEVGMQ